MSEAEPLHISPLMVPRQPGQIDIYRKVVELFSQQGIDFETCLNGCDVRHHIVDGNPVSQMYFINRVLEQIVIRNGNHDASRATRFVLSSKTGEDTYLNNMREVVIPYLVSRFTQ